MGLVPEEQTADHFEQAIAQRDRRLATGFIGTPRLLPSLHAAGKSDVAAQSPGVIVLAEGEGSVRLGVGSGEYRFVVAKR